MIWGNYNLNKSLFSVTPKHILLPAHCIQNKGGKQANSASDAEFSFENILYADRKLTAKVSEFIVHPDWDPWDTLYVADIAVAVLTEPVKLAKRIGHVCLNTPAKPIQTFARRNASVYGWGLDGAITNFGGFGPYKIDVPLIDQAKCNSSALRNLMSDTSFCAGAKDGKSGPVSGKNISDNLKLPNAVLNI